MPVVYIIHTNREELSKLRAILQGRDFLLREFQNGIDAQRDLSRLPPNIALMQFGIRACDDKPFEEVILQQKIECPIILLVEKSQVMDAVKMIGEKHIFDYFLMHPIIDPIRLHVIIDKALTQSAVFQNLDNLKSRLQSLPENLPDILNENADNLKNELCACLNEFQKRMKSEEFHEIIRLLDEKRFDQEFELFKKEKINLAIEKSRNQLSENLVLRLRNFSYNLSQQIDNPPTMEKLIALRHRLLGDNTSDEQSPPAKDSSRTNLSLNYKKKILLLAEDDQSNRGLTSIIENGGYSVILAHSPKKLLEILRNNEKIDLLICGYDLGTTTGLELIKEIKSKINKTTFPIIIVTSNPPKGLKSAPEEFGVDDILILPILPAILMEKIHSYLNAA